MKWRTDQPVDSLQSKMRNSDHSSEDYPSSSSGILQPEPLPLGSYAPGLKFSMCLCFGLYW
jgi:hypothetical protein